MQIRVRTEVDGWVVQQVLKGSGICARVVDLGGAPWLDIQSGNGPDTRSAITAALEELSRDSAMRAAGGPSYALLSAAHRSVLQAFEDNPALGAR